MNYNFQFCNQDLWIKLSSLQKNVEIARKIALKKRIANNPFINNQEYVLGAFIEMYEPHLKPIVQMMFSKGYILDKSSGFSGKYSEYQSMYGYFSIEYIIKNKIEKAGVKIRDNKSQKHLIFWPEQASIKDIVKKWIQIVDLLPQKEIVYSPIRNAYADEFRRKYKLKDNLLQKQQLFENLRFKVWKKIDNELNKRKSKKINPDKIESCLGLFLEELEDQVREAVLKLYMKGYSIDKAGFTDNPQDQMIEGDFRLDSNTKKILNSIGVEVNTNPSGYTRLQYSAKDANISKIKKEWQKIVSLIPDRKQKTAQSMTFKAREFRSKH